MAAPNNADWSETFQYFEEDGTTPISMTGKVLELWLKSSRTPSADPIFKFSTTDGTLSVLAPPNDNEVYWTISFDKMKQLSPRLYYFDILEIVSSTSRLPQGSFTFDVIQGMTESP